MNKQKLIELRCKAWGITEDEYYCNQCSDFSLEDMARAYRRGKNKGAIDKAIQNVGFYQKQMQDIYDKKNKQIAELEKENAELKGLKDVATLIRANNDTVVTLMQLNNKLVSKSQQLIKAKDHIKKLLGCLQQDTNDPQTNYYVCQYMDKAEQFLKENE